jgi:hypothetical protein
MELSPEEERHIQNLSVIPAAIVVYVFIGYVIYLVHAGQPLQPAFYLWYFLVVFMLAMPATLFLSEEILYARKVPRPLASLIRRFLGKMSIAIIGAVLFGTILEITSLTLSSLIAETEVTVLTAIIWFAAWGYLIIHYRERFKELSKGNW